MLFDLCPNDGTSAKNNQKAPPHVGFVQNASFALIGVQLGRRGRGERQKERDWARRSKENEI